MLSMTGFGRASGDTVSGHISIEIQSINRKHLEIVFYLPSSISSFEGEIRRRIAEEIQRGYVTVRMRHTPHSHSMSGLVPSLSLLKALKVEWQHLASELGESPTSITLPFLMTQFPAVLRHEPSMAISFEDVQTILLPALAAWKGMRREEGKALALDISQRLERVQQHARSLVGAIPHMIEQVRKKWRDKLQELFSSLGDIEERVYKEVALCAERADIAEELVRLQSHLQQFLSTLAEKASDAAACGKKLEFLLQEMHREVNTMSSKSSDLDMIRTLLDMKGELERVREQLQNVE